MPKLKPADASPADLYGPLLARVQERGVLDDGKTFVDAVPVRPIENIMEDFALLPEGDEQLLRFVRANFVLPESSEFSLPERPLPPLREHIRSMWTQLAREPERGAQNSSALPVGHRHVVPGGRFREIYYWDSFFTMLGLVRDGEIELANGIVDSMTDLIENHGHIPNGARTYFLGRSQPPVFHMMVALLDDRRPDVVARRLAAMKREHEWWMQGAEELSPGASAKHVARLADGSFLNRYWDPRATPRDESWGEDVATALASDRPHREVYRDLRAGAESGWDFSSRWLDDLSLSSIRTTQIAPIDLNAFLFGLEKMIGASDDSDAALFDERARVRQAAIHQHLWSEENGCFVDFDLATQRVRPAPTAASLAPLLVGLATPDQARATAAFTRNALLAPGGLRTTLVASGEQWDCPNGWAPLQWIAVTGLRRYGEDDLADEVARRWVATVEATYASTGLLHEKYNVENPSIGSGGEYEPQIGFGWTNGVTAEFLDSVAG